MITKGTRTIKIDIDDAILFKALLMAHELDITFNQFVIKAIRDALANAK